MESPQINKETQDFLLECNSEYTQSINWAKRLKLATMLAVGVVLVIFNKKSAQETSEWLSGGLVYLRMVELAKLRKRLFRNQ